MTESLRATRRRGVVDSVSAVVKDEFPGLRETVRRKVAGRIATAIGDVMDQQQREIAMLESKVRELEANKPKFGRNGRMALTAARRAADLLEKMQHGD